MAWTILPKTAQFFCFKNWCKITFQKKSSLTSARSRVVQWVKLPFFQKVHFIQKCSVTHNTVFQYVKNIFLLSYSKLLFFTKFNLCITHHYKWVQTFVTLYCTITVLTVACIDGPVITLMIPELHAGERAATFHDRYVLHLGTFSWDLLEIHHQRNQ